MMFDHVETTVRRVLILYARSWLFGPDGRLFSKGSSSPNCLAIKLDEEKWTPREPMARTAVYCSHLD